MKFMNSSRICQVTYHIVNAIALVRLLRSVHFKVDGHRTATQNSTVEMILCLIPPHAR